MSEEKLSQSPQMATSVAVPNLKKRGVKGFYKDVLRELKQVSWPSRYETTRLTGVVLAICLISTFILFVLSVAFNEIHINFLRGK